jgi:hypothetical protein
VTGIEGLSPTKRALLEQALRRRRSEQAASTAIPRRTSTGPAPLSFAQQRMWFLQQWDKTAPTFNGARALRLRGRLDRGALERALETIIERHEILRTVISAAPEATQVVLDSWSFELGVTKITESELESRLRELSREPFDLCADLMLRANLLELDDEDSVLLLRMHHIAADAHSDRVLFTELAELYDADRAGRRPALTELPIQYSDFSEWQRKKLAGPLLQKLVAYWADQLEGAPELLRLPTDRPRPPVQRHEGAHHRFALPAALGERLGELGREEGATFFITMLAVFSALLYRRSGQDDIVLGSPIANRNNVELEGLIGFFTNTIALRTRLSGNPSLREVLRRARQTALGAYAHQDLPFEKLVEALRPRRDPSYNPIFQVNFRAQATPRPQLELTDLTIEPIAVDIGFSRFDLALELDLRDRELSGFFEYDRDLFAPDTIAGLVEDLAALAQQAIDDPDAPLLTLRLARARQPARTATPGSIPQRARS